MAGKKMSERKRRNSSSSPSSPPPTSFDYASQQKYDTKHHSQHPHQPDYYNNATNNYRSTDENTYPSEKRRAIEYQEPQRLPHQKPLQMNFVAPSKGLANSYYGSR